MQLGALADRLHFVVTQPEAPRRLGRQLGHVVEVGPQARIALLQRGQQHVAGLPRGRGAAADLLGVHPLVRQA